MKAKFDQTGIVLSVIVEYCEKKKKICNKKKKKEVCCSSSLFSTYEYIFVFILFDYSNVI